MDRSTVRFSAVFISIVIGVCSMAVHAEEEKSDTSQTKLKVSGQVRFRWFLEDRDPEPRDKSVNFGDLRARVNFDARINEHTRAYIQLQSSRVMGEVREFTDVDSPRTYRYTANTSGSLYDSREISAHLAFIEMSRMFNCNMKLTVGRIPFFIANERLYGRADWDLVGRAFDGVILSPSYYGTTLDMIVLKVRDNRSNNGESIYGLRSIIPSAHIEPYIMYENDRRTSNENKDYLHRTSAGIFHQSHFREIDWMVQAIYQWGRFQGDRHIDATLIQSEFGLTNRVLRGMRTAVGVDWTTGDQLPIGSYSSVVHFFEDPYKSFEYSRGGFHLFTGEQYWGISDVYASSAFQIDQNQHLEVAFHHFETSTDTYIWVEKPINGGGTTLVKIGPSKRLGTEADINYAWQNGTGEKVEFIGSVFFPTEFFAWSHDTSPMYRFYTVITVDF